MAAPTDGPYPALRQAGAMRQPAIPVLNDEVPNWKAKPSTALATRPYEPNWTTGGQSPLRSSGPSTALATTPYVPNWTPPGRDIPTAPYAIDPEAAAMKLNAADQLAQNRLRTSAAPGYTAPMAPAEPVDLKGGSGANPSVAPAAAPPVAPPAVEPVKSGGWFKRTAAAAGNAVSSAAGSTLRAVGNTGLVALPVAAGAGLGMAQRGLDAAAAAAPQPAFTPPADAPGQIPVDPNGPQAPQHIESHPLGIGSDNEFTRNVANTMNAVTGGRTGINALRAGSAAARAFGGAEKAAQVGAQVVRGAQMVPALDPQAATAAPAAQSAVPAGDPRAQTSWGGRPGTPEAPAAAPANPNGQILRQGNSYSGDNIKFGADIVGKDGKVTNGGGFDGKGAGVSIMPSGDPAVEARARVIEDQNHALRMDAVHGNDPAPGVGGFSGATLSPSDSARGGLGPSRSVLSPSGGGGTARDRRAAAALASTERMHSQSVESAQGIASLREGGENTRAASHNNVALATSQMANATSLRNNQNTNDVAMRGHDLTYQGHMAPLRYQQSRMAMAGQYLKQFGDPAAAAAAALSHGNYDVAKHLSEGVSTMQGQAKEQQGLEKGNADRTRAKFNGRFNHMVGEGTPEQKVAASKALEDEAHNLARQTYPGFDSMSDKEQNEAMPKIVGTHELIKKTGDISRGGWAGLLPNAVTGQSQFAPTQALRGKDFWDGSKLEDPYGGVEAAVTPGYTKGDTVLRLGAGRGQANLGKLSEEAKAVYNSLRK